jgi:hypothetical protein
MQQNVSDLSLPIFVNGTLPSPESANPQIIQTADNPEVALITVNQQVLVLQDSTGFTMTVSATDATGEPTKVSATGQLIVDKQNSLTVSGSGFKPNSKAVAWIFSEPNRLGVVDVGADGSFQESIPMGDDIPPGDHTSQVNGVTAAGGIRSLNLAIAVVEELPESTDEAQEPDTGSGAESADGSPDGTTAQFEADDDTTQLVIVVTLVAIVSVAATSGGYFILGARRRRRKEKGAS